MSNIDDEIKKMDEPFSERIIMAVWASVVGLFVIDLVLIAALIFINWG